MKKHRKGLPALQIVNGHWRGVMPFHSPSSKLSRNHLDLQRRTGEPSPSFGPEGYDKTRGSLTEALRNALHMWVTEKFGSYSAPISFEYKLYRHRTVVVTGTLPYIKHDPKAGRGLKGFLLLLHVSSIDGLPADFLFRRSLGAFSMTRIIGHQKIFLLPNKEVQ